MFGSTRSGANAYATVGVETGVTAATPHKLIVMLFEGALVAISSARMHMQAGNIPAKGQAISKAILIVENGLRASLNKDAGGSIAANLDSLYQYISAQLLNANIKNKVETLDEVHRLLKDLKESWEAIGEPQEKPAAAAEAPQPVVNDPLAPHTTRLMKA
jgi:flagellar protein FliS